MYVCLGRGDVLFFPSPGPLTLLLWKAETGTAWMLATKEYPVY